MFSKIMVTITSLTMVSGMKTQPGEYSPGLKNAIPLKPINAIPMVLQARPERGADLLDQQSRAEGAPLREDTETGLMSSVTETATESDTEEKAQEGAKPKTEEPKLNFETEEPVSPYEKMWTYVSVISGYVAVSQSVNVFNLIQGNGEDWLSLTNFWVFSLMFLVSSFFVVWNKLGDQAAIYYGIGAFFSMVGIGAGSGGAHVAFKLDFAGNQEYLEALDKSAFGDLSGVMWGCITLGLIFMVLTLLGSTKKVGLCTKDD